MSETQSYLIKIFDLLAKRAADGQGSHSMTYVVDVIESLPGDERGAFAANVYANLRHLSGITFSDVISVVDGVLAFQEVAA